MFQHASLLHWSAWGLVSKGGKKICDRGMEAFMSKRLVSAHLMAVCVATLLGFQVRWCLQTLACITIRGGHVNPEKYTSCNKNSLNLVFFPLLTHAKALRACENVEKRVHEGCYHEAKHKRYGTVIPTNWVLSHSCSNWPKTTLGFI